MERPLLPLHTYNSLIITFLAAFPEIQPQVCVVVRVVVLLAILIAILIATLIAILIAIAMHLYIVGLATDRPARQWAFVIRARLRYVPSNRDNGQTT